MKQRGYIRLNPIKPLAKGTYKDRPLENVKLCYECAKQTLELFEANPILRELVDNAIAKDTNGSFDAMFETGVPWAVLLRWKDHDPFVFVVNFEHGIEVQRWTETDIRIVFEGPFDLLGILQAMGMSAHDIAVAEFEAARKVSA